MPHRPSKLAATTSKKYSAGSGHMSCWWLTNDQTMTETIRHIAAASSANTRSSAYQRIGFSLMLTAVHLGRKEKCMLWLLGGRDGRVWHVDLDRDRIANRFAHRHGAGSREPELAA